MYRPASSLSSGTVGTRSQVELSRLISAAVINEKFCRTLLDNPAKALVAGYGGESFHLPSEEKARISSIRATSLADFARQLTQIPESGHVPMTYCAGD
jgi:hypothetical protein